MCEWRTNVDRVGEVSSLGVVLVLDQHRAHVSTSGLEAKRLDHNGVGGLVVGGDRRGGEHVHARDEVHGVPVDAVLRFGLVLDH